MTPRILEYEEGRLRVTENAFIIPELKAILDKHDMSAEPYLAYVHLMTAVDSPYINVPDEEKIEVVVYDIINTIGDFDNEDEILAPAIEKLNKLYTSPTKNYYNGLKTSIDRMADYLRITPITGGSEGNLAEIIRLHKEAGSTIRSFKDIERQVDEELKVKTRGNQEVGEY